MEIRFAERKDISTILKFIMALAEYEHMTDQVVADEKLLEEWIFAKGKAEVLFVLPEYRGRGCGKALIRKLASIASERGCGRLEWNCLDWNRPSIDFYLSLGAVPMSDWTLYRVTGERLKELGS